MKHVIITLALIISSIITVNAQQTIFDNPWYNVPNEKGIEYVDSLCKTNSITTEEFLDVKNQINAIDNMKNAPTILLNVNWWSINSADGIEISYTVINCSLKKIKYITITSYFKNPVGDICYNKFGGKYMEHIFIGPLQPRPKAISDNANPYESEGTYEYNTPTFYCGYAHTIHIASIKIQYFDGSCKLLNGKMLNNIVSYEDDWDNSNYNPLFGLNYYLNNKLVILNKYKN